MPPRLDGAADLRERVRLHVLERQVLQLAADFSHPEAVRDRRVNLDGLPCDPLAPLLAQVRERSHIVEAVRQLHHDHADVFHHGEKHLAEALGLAVLGGEEVELGELSDAIDASRHIVAELFAYLVHGDAGVFHHVVQNPCDHGDGIHPHVGEDMCHHYGVDHVGLARIAALPLVILAGEVVGLFQRREVVFGAVLANLDFQLAVKQIRGIRGRRRHLFREAGNFGGHCTFDCSRPKKNRSALGTERLSKSV
jgi:hypothetical protein